MSAIPSALCSPRFWSTWMEIRKWLARGLFALTDQGLISGSNFVLGVLLARWVGPAEYGVYALAFATFLLLSLVHYALLLEPMSVFGSGIYRSALRRYLGLLLWIQLVLAPLFFVVLAAASFGVGIAGFAPQLTPALLGVAFAAPAVLILWFARRALYLKYSSGLSTIGALLYCGVLFGGLAILHRSSSLSALYAFVLMGIAAICASVFLLRLLRPDIEKIRLGAELKEVGSRHWNYGRWALASSFFIWVPWNLYYTVLSSFSGFAAAGELRALLNLALPMAQTYAALALLMLPRAARVAQEKGWPGVKREALNIAGVFTAIALIYWSIVIHWREPLLGTLYSGNYASVARLIPWLAIASIASGTIFGPLCAFRAMHSPSTVCWLYAVSSIIGAAVGVPTTRALGLDGAILGIVLSSLLALTIAIFLLLRHRMEPAAVACASLADSLL